MKVNIHRVMKGIERLSEFNSTPEKGCTRYSYSKEDLLARKYLINQMKEAGFEVRVDNIGNIKGVLKGTEEKLPVVISGSHIDTVKHGGNYDGILGVVAAIEVGRVIKENNLKHRRGYQVVVFTEEEGSNFSVNLLGSKAIAGKVDFEEIKDLKDNMGISMVDMIEKLGVNSRRVSECRIPKEEIYSMIELHIEQGRVLDEENISVGIVKGINALNWYEVRIEGEANHAGATPMKYRKDALIEASKLISKIPTIVEKFGDESNVATVGVIECKPNLPNVIPKEVKFTIDLRGIEPDTNRRILEEIKNELKKIENGGVKTSIKELTKAKETKSKEEILKIIEEKALKRKISYKFMYSGSNHDTSIISEICDVAMIFVPSVNGSSHCPEEYTKEIDIQNGCQLLLDTVEELIK